METLFQDLRYGARMLVKDPTLSLIIIFVLALGIGSTTAIFSVFNTVLLRPLPISDAGRVAVIHLRMPQLNMPRAEISPLQYQDFSRSDNAFESTAAMTGQTLNLTGGDTPERLQAGRVTASFFPTLGISLAAGRPFSDDEDRDGASHVTVLTDALCKHLFNGDARAALGQSLKLNGETYQIVGIAPAALEELYPHVDTWIPAAWTPAELSNPRRWSLYVTMVARLKPGMSFQGAQAIMSAAAEPGMQGDVNGTGIEVRPIVNEKLADVRKPMILLLWAVGAVLLIACVNISGLLLARGASRSREVAIRAALGAARVRIVRQLLTESILAAVIGGGLGLLVATWGIGALLKVAPASLPRIAQVRMDPGVLIFGLAVSIACGILSGLMPAIASSRIDLVTALKEVVRTASAGSGERLRQTLVVAEIAIALMVLISAGLLARSFDKLSNVSPGFNPANVLTVRMSLARTQYPDRARVSGFYRSLLERVAALPGVSHAAAAYDPPFLEGDTTVFFIRNRQAAAGDPATHANYAYVTPDYFAAMGIPILRGEGFSASDLRTDNQPGSWQKAIIDQALVDRFWRDSDPIGAEIAYSEKGPWAKVVAVVNTVHAKDLAERPEGTFYVPTYAPASTLVVRTTVDPRSLTAAIKEQVAAVDPNQPVYDIQTMEQRLGRSLDERRFAFVLLSLFAVVALILATVGIYGMTAYMVSQRSREIGIRVALGARSSDVLRLVLAHGMRLTLLGLVLGLCGAFALSRLMTSLLFGVTATDPIAFVTVGAVLAASAILGCYLPARRGARVDPMVALRVD